MDITSPILIPVSRLRRELNKWIRVIDKTPNTVLYITRNQIKTTVMVSPSYCENLRRYCK